MIVGAIDGNAASNPLNKEVIREAGAWLHNFEQVPVLRLAPALGVLMSLLSVLASRLDKGGLAF